MFKRINRTKNKISNLFYWNDKKAQIILGEYVLLFFLTLSALSLMTIFFRRAIQARMRASRWAMQRTVRNFYNGTIYMEYEPYYLQRSTLVDSQTDQTRILEGGGSSGVFTQTYDDETTAITDSWTNPPRDAD